MSMIKLYTPSFISQLLRKTVPAVALLFTSLGLASQANAFDIRQAQIDSCTSQLVTYQITDIDSATQLCTCDVDVQANMTIGQVWEIQSYIRSNKDPSELPFFVKMQQDSLQCKEGITLNPPQPPQSPQQ